MTEKLKPCAEPVMWQGRRAYHDAPEWDEWSYIHPDNLKLWQEKTVEKPHMFQLRALYAHPSKSAGAATPDEGEAWISVWKEKPPIGEDVFVWREPGDGAGMSGVCIDAWAPHPQTGELMWASERHIGPMASNTHWRKMIAGPSAPKGEEPRSC